MPLLPQAARGDPPEEELKRRRPTPRPPNPLEDFGPRYPGTVGPEEPPRDRDGVTAAEAAASRSRARADVGVFVELTGRIASAR